MQVIIKDCKESACDFVANYIASKIKKNNKCVLGLPTGSTPVGVYSTLVKLHQKDNLSFKNVISFNMDEYVGLPPSNEASYHYFMHEHLFSHIDMDDRNINILDGMATDIKKECREYEEKISSTGGIELFLGGVGVDGHIAFNEQFSSLSSRTHCVSLNDVTIRQNARFFDGDLTKVPKKALTVGTQTIMDAKEVIILAFGVEKANALSQAVDGGVTHKSTISVLQLHPNATIICDKEAASALSEEALKYFEENKKWILSNMLDT